MEVLGTGCQRRAIPTAVLRMLSGPPYGGLVEILFEQSRPPILCHHLGAFAHEAEADEQADIPTLGNKFTVDTAFAWSAWIQWISFPRVDFFPTMDSLLGPSGFGKRENRNAGEGRRPIASLHEAGWLNVVSKRPGEACDAPAVDRGSDDNRNNQSSQAGIGELPVAPCTFLAPSTLDSKPVEARWDYICPRDRICSFEFSGLSGPSGVLEASIFILKAGLQNRAFAASVRTKEGTTYYYTENPTEFSWSVQNMTLQCKPQL
jgi:hypothetical protein